MEAFDLIAEVGLPIASGLIIKKMTRGKTNEKI